MSNETKSEAKPKPAAKPKEVDGNQLLLAMRKQATVFTQMALRFANPKENLKDQKTVAEAAKQFAATADDVVKIAGEFK